MAENNTLLEKLEGLVSRFEEVSTLITDPNVIADQKRYVKLTKEYKELGDLMAARKEYLQCLNGLEEAKMMMSENDPEMMWLTTMNPESRRLIKVLPTDVEETARVFDLLLGDNLAGRKEHIAQHGAEYLDDLDVS